MTTGQPDGGVNQYGNASAASDIGSLTNYLWGFSPVDGRGRMVYMDTFNNGLSGWHPVYSGAGSAAASLSNEINFMPPYSALLNAGTTGPLGNGFSEIVRSFQLSTSFRLGAEFSVQVGGAGGDNVPGAYEMELFLGRGTDQYAGSMRLSVSDRKWQVYTPSGYVDIPGADYPAGYFSSYETAYVQSKMVVDFSTGKYVRALIGENQYDLSSYDMATAPVASNEGMATVAVFAWADGTNTNGRIGYVIFTKDEP